MINTSSLSESCIIRTTPSFSVTLRARTMAAKNGYVRMRANTENDVIATCGQQLKHLKGFRNPRAPLTIEEEKDLAKFVEVVADIGFGKNQWLKRLHVRKPFKEEQNQ